MLRPVLLAASDQRCALKQLAGVHFLALHSDVRCVPSVVYAPYTHVILEVLAFLHASNYMHVPPGPEK